MAPEHGDVRRRLSTAKMRSMAFNAGCRNYRIRAGGLDVHPLLRQQEGGKQAPSETMGSGVAGLAALLGGGLEKGTACVVVGPTGTGSAPPRPGQLGTEGLCQPSSTSPERVAWQPNQKRGQA